MGGGSHRGGEHCQIQSGVPLFVDRGGRVVQVRVGGTRQDKTGKDVTAAFEKDLETE